MLMMTLLLALVQVAVNIWKDVIYWDPASINLGIAKGIWNEFIILARTCALASDTLVLAVTYYFSFELRQGTGHLRWSTGASLTKVLVRDGTIFFVALFLVYLLEILAWHFGSMFFVSDFTLPLMSILVSRFLMNLRRAASSSTFTVDTQTPSYVHDGLDTTTVMSSLKFSPQSRGADPEDVGHTDSYANSDEIEQLDDPSIIVPAEEMVEYSIEMGGNCGEPASEPYIVTVSRNPGER
ncbi:hypothetical protein DAEQUDRAFT_394305 [Daedalea quercina L-15889]|uniref:Uncharacterized protein n=1 Tax=Daedalea quercina L-15889 TaxID=1314783 RepID=A0A165NWY4_9APHY|nr:hypothetical protein DAEQUDRAFT_394305 [Daedalea quercina L-15889]